jgi:hypothetical protein
MMQSTIYDNSGGYGPYTVGVPVYQNVIRVRVPNAASTTTTAAASKYQGKHIGVLPLATFIAIAIAGGVVLCSCLCAFCSSRRRYPRYTPPPSSSTYTNRPTYSTYTPPLPRPAPLMLSSKNKPEVVVPEEPEPANYPPVRVR